MTEIVELEIRMPKDVATKVNNLLALIPAVEIVGMKPCVNKTSSEEGNSNGLHLERIPSDEPKNYQFIEKSKEVVRKIAELNGKRLTLKPKGKAIDFVVQFDAESCCDVLDELYENHEYYIDEYLSGVQKPSGISIVLPFVGKIIEFCIFSSEKSMHKESLTKKLQEIYKDSTNIVGYLSYDGRKKKDELKELAKKVADIALEKGVATLS